MTTADSPEKEANRPAGRALMQSVVTIEVTDGPDKLVWLPSERQPVLMGMHDELAEHYNAVAGTFEPRASTLDYVIGAVGACLTGTFKRALLARGVKLASGDLNSQAIGEIIVEGDVPIIRAIEVRYRLSGTLRDDRAKIRRAHAVHHKACAVSRSVEQAIEIKTVLELT
jgi:uncharacterized OsmC-like protein